MRILLLTHAFNGLAQRLYVELTAAGHDVAVEFDINDRVTEEAVALWQPELIVAPFLKRAIPESIWRHHRCLIVHPGIRGDRGPSALDWAITGGEREWGVTVLEATGDLDAGPVWATVGFPMRDAAKSSLYRNEVTAAAVAAVERALARLVRPGTVPEAPDRADPAHAAIRGQLRPPMRQADRAIDWRADDTATILRKIRAADGFPGVEDEIRGLPCRLFDAHREGRLRGAAPGEVVAQRDGAVCRATVDGAVWITHLKAVGSGAPAFKLPAAMVLGARVADVPEMPLAPTAAVAYPTWRPIRYEEAGAVGILHFPFHNGAMGTVHCDALRAAYVAARARPTRVIVLAGGSDFWSNGIHLNLIEAAAHPAEESWRNINAMDDLVREILLTDRQLTVAALQGNAGAGGVFLALAADRVLARDDVVLNPHYKGMGNLYGSEYWTYVLPRRVGAGSAAAVTANRLPVGARRAAAMGLVDAHFGADPTAFLAEAVARAGALAADPGFEDMIAAKCARRQADEAAKPLERYRTEELERMQLNFFGFDPSYHVARYNFVHKVPRSRTPLWLAPHRRRAVGAGRP
jgi:putative two-component system hydrogenase maturation factor HypX/HoxX